MVNREGRGDDDGHAVDVFADDQLTRLALCHKN